jgi:hypothetical protein
MAQNIVSLPGSRTVGTVTAAQWTTSLGIGINIFSIGHTAQGGYFTDPFYVPDDADLSRPMSLYQRIRNPVDIGATAKVIAFQFSLSRVNLGVPAATETIDVDFPVPANWPVDADADILLDPTGAPLGVTIPGGTLERGAILGVRCRRNSLVAQDTYDSIVYMLAALRLTYYRRCQFAAYP